MATKQQTEGAQFVRYFGPLLDALRTLGGSGTPSEVVEQIAADLKVSDKAQADLLPSGTPRFPNQVAWARFYLTREGLLDASKRGVWSLTDKGRRTVLSSDQARALFLKWVRVFTDERKKKEIEGRIIDPPPPVGGYREALLTLLLSLPPAGFERLSQRLLRESGFVQVAVTGRSGDGGIDGYGTLQVNPLVSFKVIFQCKRYANSVSAPQVRDFRGAMQGRADKGIIITTGTFTADARREATRDGVPPIELLDGEKLVTMFAEAKLGVREIIGYEIDETFFEEFRKKD